MIILTGQSHDDVLYFENVLRNKRFLKPLFNKYPMIRGNIFNQDVLIVYDCVTSYVSSIVLSKLISDFKPFLVLSLGRCKAINPEIKNGTCVISKRFVGIDIDQCEFFDTEVGQMPGFNKEFMVVPSLISMAVDSFDISELVNYKVCTFLSSNRMYTSVNKMREFGQGHVYLGIEDDFILENEGIGMALACQLYDVPFMSIKIVDSQIGEISDVDSFVETLASYADIGKAICSLIGEVGRRDFVS